MDHCIATRLSTDLSTAEFSVLADPSLKENPALNANIAFRTGPPTHDDLLPDPAGVLGHHGLTHFASEGFAEFRHVPHHPIDPELPR